MFLKTGGRWAAMVGVAPASMARGLPDENKGPETTPGETVIPVGNPRGGVSWQRRSLRVGSTQRTFAVRFPETWQGAPLVLGFHGHGGTGLGAALRWRLASHFPEAVLIFPDGLPTRTGRDPRGERPGWALQPGSNRDLEFTDALLDLARCRWGVDTDRTAVTGHSNGAGFTFLLYGTRPYVFSAFVPVAGAGARLVGSGQPAPLLAVTGRHDPIVDFASQELAVKAVRAVNGDVAPVEWLVHDGGHEWPVDLTPRIAAFLRSHRRIKDVVAPVR